MLNCLKYIWSIFFYGDWDIGVDFELWELREKTDATLWRFGPIEYIYVYFDYEFRVLWVGPLYIQNVH